MFPQNYFTFPFYIPRICSLWTNWPEYLFNYVALRFTRRSLARTQESFVMSRNSRILDF